MVCNPLKKCLAPLNNRVLNVIKVFNMNRRFIICVDRNYFKGWNNFGSTGVGGGH